MFYLLSKTHRNPLPHGLLPLLTVGLFLSNIRGCENFAFQPI